MMWHRYPYLNEHDMNLDWILAKIKELDGEMDEFKALNKITFDGEWDITKQYPAWCIVNTNGGTQGYISIKPVPAGVVITNTDYWASVVDYTATIADLQNRVVTLENTVGDASSGLVKDVADLQNNDLAKKYFNGKHVFIVGDSISDNTTNPPNWTTYFTTFVESNGGTVTNGAQNGNSFAGYVNAGYPGLVAADIYIVFLGLNDCDGQWPWKSGSLYSIYDSFIATFNQLYTLNPDCDIWFVSPLKNNHGAYEPTPIYAYTHFYEHLAVTKGARIISGFDAPALCNETFAQYMSDNIHPDNTYAPILADYIIRNILSGCNSKAINGVYRRTYDTSDMVTGSGYIDMAVDSDLNAFIKFTAFTPDASRDTWNRVIELPLCYADVTLVGSCSYNNTLQYKVDVETVGATEKAYLCIWVSSSYTNELFLPITLNSSYMA